MRRTPLRKVSVKRKLQLLQERELRLRLYKLQDGKCAVCGGTGDWRGFSLHHKIFRSHGGKSTEENCEIICAVCHSLKHGIKEE